MMPRLIEKCILAAAGGQELYASRSISLWTLMQMQNALRGTKKFQHPEGNESNAIGRCDLQTVANLTLHWISLSLSDFDLDVPSLHPSGPRTIDPKIFANLATWSRGPAPSEPTKASTMRLHGIVLTKSKLNHPRMYALAMTLWSVMTS